MSTAQGTLHDIATMSETPMFALLRSIRSRPASDPSTPDCATARAVGESTFERLHSTPVAGLGAELHEWLPIAWAQSAAGVASARCRA